jgi:hypothetical protein
VGFKSVIDACWFRALLKACRLFQAEFQPLAHVAMAFALARASGCQPWCPRAVGSSVGL